jgi:hypothetical protein
MLIGQAEGTAPEEVAAGRMRDRGGTGPQLAAYVCHLAVDGVLADLPPWGGTLVLPFASVVAAVACGTSTYRQAPGVERQRQRYPPQC